MTSSDGGYLDVQATCSFILFAEDMLHFTSTQPRNSLLCGFNRCSQLTQGRMKGVIPGYSAQLLFLSQLGPFSIDFIYSDSGRGQLRDTENRPFLCLRTKQREFDWYILGKGHLGVLSLSASGCKRPSPLPWWHCASDG